MSRPALINLVRKSLVSASVTHDYTTPGELAARHDEVKLVDPDGDPCAVPMQPQEDDIDYQYNYVTGAKGHAVRGTLVDIDLSIDYIDDATWSKLKQWQRERALVWLQPNLGRNTVFSWRAVDMKAGFFDGGPAAKDLTGNYSLTATYGQYLRYWDAERRLFLPKTTGNKAQIVATRGGGGLVSFPSVVNRMVPTYPKSATLGSGATESGWEAGGADFGHISAAHVSGGFGQADCPDSLRVTVSASASSDRYLYITDQFDSAHANYAGYAFANSLSAMATVWLRGRLPAGATLMLGTNIYGGSDYTERSLAGLRLDGWTPVTVQHYSTAWASNPAFVVLRLNDTNGMACEFEIGPTMICQQSGYSGMPAAAVWTPQVTGGTASGTSRVATGSSVRLPGQGTLVCSFWAPADLSATWRALSTMELCGNTDLRLRYTIGTSGSDTISIVGVSPANTVAYTVATRGGLGFAGRLNTVAVAWGPTGVKLYVNGELVATDTSALPALSGSNSAWQVGGNSSSGYCCSPLAMLTCRIEEGEMTATEIAQVHTALTDPVAVALALTAAGRTFRIRRVPQTMRSSALGSQVLGVLGLGQVDYDPFTADPYSKEANVG